MGNTVNYVDCLRHCHLLILRNLSLHLLDELGIPFCCLHGEGHHRRSLSVVEHAVTCTSGCLGKRDEIKRTPHRPLETGFDAACHLPVSVAFPGSTVQQVAENPHEASAFAPFAPTLNGDEQRNVDGTRCVPLLVKRKI